MKTKYMKSKHSYIGIDFHIHTKFSPDSDSNPRRVHNVCIRHKIIPAITDHNTIRAWEHTPKPFIPGEEIKSSSGDIIGLYITDKIQKNMGVEETFDKVREQGGLIYLPHMFDLTRRGIGSRADKKILSKSNIIEVLNGRSTDMFDRRARMFAERYNLIQAAGSDAHNVSEVGNCYVEFSSGANKVNEIDEKEIQENPKYLLKLFKHSKPICKKRSTLAERMRTKWVKFKKSMFKRT